MEARRTRSVPGGGWVMFAAVLFLLLGVFNMLDGIVALARDSHFTEDLFFGNFTFWGIVLLLVGGPQLYASMQVFSGQGQMPRIYLLTLSLIVRLLFLGSRPV